MVILNHQNLCLCNVLFVFFLFVLFFNAFFKTIKQTNTTNCPNWNQTILHVKIMLHIDHAACVTNVQLVERNYEISEAK